MIGRAATIVLLTCFLAMPAAGQRRGESCGDPGHDSSLPCVQLNGLQEAFQRLCDRYPSCISTGEKARRVARLSSRVIDDEAASRELERRVYWRVLLDYPSYDGPVRPLRQWLQTVRQGRYKHCGYNQQYLRLSHERDKERELSCMIETGNQFRSILRGVLAAYEQL